MLMACHLLYFIRQSKKSMKNKNEENNKKKSMKNRKC